jgi:hypothetical protein
LFFDLSQGLGALSLGAVVAVTSERGAFIAAGVGSALGLWLHRRWASLWTPTSSIAVARPPAEPGE